MAKLSVIQLCAQPNVEENLNTIDEVLTSLPKADEHLVLLPECCLFFWWPRFGAVGARKANCKS